jgi:Zn-dependent protease
MGSLIFLLTMRIGWGKPVPVNPANFKAPVRDSALTALAGPMSNFILSFFVALPLKYLGAYMPEYVAILLWMIFDVSIFLGIFNLFPFPPLDGSKILGLIVPARWHRKYQNYLYEGMKYFVVIIMIDVFVLPRLVDFSFFGFLVGKMYDVVRNILLLGT